MFIGNVADTFEIKGRGVEVAIDRTVDQLPKELRIYVGDPVEFRSAGAALFQTTISGIGFCDPPNPHRPFAFLVMAAKTDVPIGAEVWSLRAPGARTVETAKG